MDPRASEVAIEDIAHSLSMQCRYAGHCLRFYSVAEHSVLLARYFRQRGAPVVTQLWALLHDASEAYLVDVPRPVKPYLDGYRQVEASVMAAICERFGLPHRMPAEVHEADAAIIGNERGNLAPCVAEWDGEFSGLTGVYLRNWQPHVAELEFTAEFRRLMDERYEEGREPMDPIEARHDREASRVDWEYQFRKEQEAKAA
jgi:5'-deoxynucleotidase YfbR-like HD superfamily hydrolase